MAHVQYVRDVCKESHRPLRRRACAWPQLTRHTQREGAGSVRPSLSCVGADDENGILDLRRPV